MANRLYIPKSTDLAVSAGGAAVTLTYAAVSGKAHIFQGVVVSYSATPTGGNLLIKRGATTVQNIDVPTTGPFVYEFPMEFQGSVGEAVSFTLAGGGGAVVGKISAMHRLGA